MSSDTARPRAWLEIAVVFGLSTAICRGLYWGAARSSFFSAILHAGIAGVLLYAPILASRVTGRTFDYAAAGLYLVPRPADRRMLLRVVLITWPLFLAAFAIFYGGACQVPTPAFLAAWGEFFAANCVGWLGFSGARFALPSGFAMFAASQLIAVALPEELFFRGYLWSLLETHFAGRKNQRNLVLFWSAMLFAFGHVGVDFDPQRFIVFLPGLVFGFMRARTGSVWSGAVFHAGCNILAEILHASFFVRP